ncbi:MAG: gliding motility-associated C-terminal domain-containing protein [Bacteroidales bacterium]|nr:gliding motility-associated C-terminal domain-containing protein [Candidatus Colimorpha onthohippi]
MLHSAKPFAFVIGLLLTLMQALATTPSNHAQHSSHENNSRVTFIENVGQWDAPFCFKTHTSKSIIYADSAAITLVVHANDPTLPAHAIHHHPQRYHAYRMSFVNALHTCPKGLDQAETYDNYYLGRDRKRWRHHVHHYGTVFYPNVWHGIDLSLQATTQGLKYNLIVAPDADIRQIAIRYEGASRIKKTRNGDILIQTTATDITELAPYAYQECDTGNVAIPVQYRLTDNLLQFEIGSYNHKQPLVIDPQLIFSTYTGATADNWGTTATYDSEKNTYTSGLVFDVGYPTSLGAFDTNYHGGTDISIFKFDTTGSVRLYATYLGGNQADMPHSLFVNAFDELVLFGTTGSNDFPVTPTAFDTTFHGGTPLFYESNGINFPNGSDIFVSRFSADGSQLQASTYVGGSANDGLNFRHDFNNLMTTAPTYIDYMAGYKTLMFGNDSLYYNYGDGARGETIVDDQNNVYVGSTTFSTDFPTTDGCVQPASAGGQEGIVFKLDYNLSNMIWSTYLGGSKDDAVYSIEVDEDYNLLVCGGTESADFPTTANAYKSTYAGGATDGFVCKLSYHGDQLMASTFFGDQWYDQCYFVRCGHASDVFIFGQTKTVGSTLIHNAEYGMPGGGQFLAHLTPNLDSLVWSTLFGSPNSIGRPNLSPTAFGADVCNRVYAVGWGRDFVGYYDGNPIDGYRYIDWNMLGTTGMETTPDAFQTVTDGQDFYILSLSMDASNLDYASFFGEVYDGTGHGEGGGDHVDGGTSRFDRLGTLYQSVCASCNGNSSDDFPTTPGAWSRVNNSNNCNNAVFRFNIHSNFALAEFSAVPVGCAPYEVAFNNTGRGTAFEWDFGDGTTSTLRNPTHTYAKGGEYTVRLRAHLNSGCIDFDSTSRTIRVIGTNSRRLDTIAQCDPTPVQIGFSPISGCAYKWIQGTVSDPYIANPYTSESGTYILQITTNTDAGCIENDTFDVYYYDLLDTLIVKQPLCPNDSGYAWAVANHFAHDSITYIWDGQVISHPGSRESKGDPQPIDTATGGSSMFGPVPSRNYPHTLTITDGKCSTSCQFVIFTPAPVITKDASTHICDSCDGHILISYSDSRNMPFCYLWDDGNTDTLRRNLCEGRYCVVVSDTNGCASRSCFKILQHESFDNLHVWADDSAVYEGSATQLHITPIAGASYQWSPQSLLQKGNSANPVATIYQPTTFSVTVTDTAGCNFTDTIHVGCMEVACGQEDLFIPNAFSPDADGINDQLCFRVAPTVTDFHFVLFNRWGEIVFETSDPTKCWDGRFRNTMCPPGVYMYTCNITCLTGKQNAFKGDITLIR